MVQNKEQLLRGGTRGDAGARGGGVRGQVRLKPARTGWTVNAGQFSSAGDHQVVLIHSRGLEALIPEPERQESNATLQVSGGQVGVQRAPAVLLGPENVDVHRSAFGTNLNWENNKHLVRCESRVSEDPRLDAGATFDPDWTRTREQSCRTWTDPDWTLSLCLSVRFLSPLQRFWCLKNLRGFWSFLTLGFGAVSFPLQNIRCRATERNTLASIKSQRGVVQRIHQTTKMKNIRR